MVKIQEYLQREGGFSKLLQSIELPLHLVSVFVPAEMAQIQIAAEDHRIMVISDSRVVPVDMTLTRTSGF